MGAKEADTTICRRAHPQTHWRYETPKHLMVCRKRGRKRWCMCYTIMSPLTRGSTLSLQGIRHSSTPSPSSSPAAQFDSGTYFCWKQWVTIFVVLIGLESSTRVMEELVASMAIRSRP